MCLGFIWWLTWSVIVGCWCLLLARVFSCFVFAGLFSVVNVVVVVSWLFVGLFCCVWFWLDCVGLCVIYAYFCWLCVCLFSVWVCSLLCGWFWSDSLIVYFGLVLFTICFGCACCGFGCCGLCLLAVTVLFLIILLFGLVYGLDACSFVWVVSCYLDSVVAYLLVWLFDWVVFVFVVVSFVICLLC